MVCIIGVDVDDVFSCEFELVSEDERIQSKHAYLVSIG